MCTVDWPAGCRFGGVQAAPEARRPVAAVVEVDTTDVVPRRDATAFFARVHEPPPTSANTAKIRTATRRTRTPGSVPGCLADAHAGRRDGERARSAPRAVAVRRGDGPGAVRPT